MPAPQDRSFESFDREKWNALLEYDDLIAEIARKLRPLGQKWLDEFAASYLAINDKSYLPVIVQKIIAKAKAESAELERKKAARAKRIKLRLASGLIISCAAFSVIAILTIRAKDNGFDGIYEQFKANSLGFYNKTDLNNYVVTEEKRRAQEQANLAAAEETRKRAEMAQQAEAEERRKKQEAAQKAADAAKALAEEAACIKDLHCLGEKYFPDATVACTPLVERIAKNNFEWIDKWYETKFSHYRWKDRPAAVITYLGDKIKYQNGFGAWTLSVYECDFDTKTKTVVDVRAMAGRL
jgi:hypothetical protein